ncbi:MAG: type II secretion system protein GspL [Proteobacteria bacterium]|nr:type II secretion system protein GspL [Pseudomonadota bacterium]
MNLNTTLRLLITADWPAQDPACEWALLNAQGNTLQLGRSEPRHWPAAEACEVVLSAEQCLLLKVQLPKGARSRPAEVIAYALEDQLIGEADGEHFVVGAEGAATADSTAPTPVWVIARTRLKTLLAALTALERRPLRVISELQLARVQAGGWSVCLHSDNATGFARLGSEEGFAFDLADIRQPPLELRLALRAAQQDGGVPLFIDVYSARSKDEAFDSETALAWQSDLTVPIRPAGEYVWRDQSSQDARNLLSGEFAPPRAANSGWGSFKPAMWLGLVVLVAYCLFSFGEWLWLDHQSERLRQQMTESFRAAYPQAQTIVDPPLQMQRLNDQLRRARGQVGSTDFLPLLAAATETLGAQGRLRSLSYEDGRLELTLLLADSAAAERAQKTLTSRGLAATLRDTRPASGGVEAVFALRGTP